MTKQEFLAMSLPYGLKFAHFHSELFNCIADIWSDLVNGYYRFIPLNNGRKIIRLTSLKDYKPILHPLSDLTKEIEHNGETFVPIDRLNELFGYKYCKLVYYVNSGIGWCIDSSFSDTAISFDNMYLPIKKLIEWHFDIAGLIEKGEAIDVNTLSENPYK